MRRSGARSTSCSCASPSSRARALPTHALGVSSQNRRQGSCCTPHCHYTHHTLARHVHLKQAQPSLALKTLCTLHGDAHAHRAMASSVVTQPCTGSALMGAWMPGSVEAHSPGLPPRCMSTPARPCTGGEAAALRSCGSSTRVACASRRGDAACQHRYVACTTQCLVHASWRVHAMLACRHAAWEVVAPVLPDCRSCKFNICAARSASVV